MSILGIACELEAVSRSAASVTGISTAGSFVAPARGAIDVPYGQYVDSLPWIDGATCTDTFGFTVDVNPAGYIAATPTCYLYDSSNNPFFRLYDDGGSLIPGGNIRAQTSVDGGTTWVSHGALEPMPNAVLYTLTGKIKINSASGHINLWKGDVSIVDVAVDLSAVADCAKFRWYGSSYNTTSDRLSKMIWASGDDLRDYKITPYWPTGQGANTAETGTYADIDELDLNDSDAISFASNGDIGTFIHAATATPTGHAIVAVVVSSRVRKGASGIANYKHVLRIGSTNYPSTNNVNALDTGYGPRQSLWTSDPSTSAAFGSVPAEFGGEGIT